MFIYCNFIFMKHIMNSSCTLLMNVWHNNVWTVYIPKNISKMVVSSLYHFRYGDLTWERYDAALRTINTSYGTVKIVVLIAFVTRATYINYIENQLYRNLWKVKNMIFRFKNAEATPCLPLGWWAVGEILRNEMIILNLRVTLPCLK